MPENQPKRVLIVDDEPKVVNALAASLSSAGNAYDVETANNADEALEKIQQGLYTLLITDYIMPEMNGLDLARAVRLVSPETQVVLMTAYGTDGLRNTAEGELDGFLDKPFSVAQIREIVSRAIGQTQTADPYSSGEESLEHPVYEQLSMLQSDTGARCVVLLSSNGYPVETAGVIDGLDVTNIGALVAANFAAASELARLLGRGSVFKSSYHEGDKETDDNIYAYAVNSEFLLAVVFSDISKPGIVWLYTKQTAASLLALLEGHTANTLAGEPAPPTDEMENQINARDNILSLEDAIAAGLLPDDFGTRSESLDKLVAEELDLFLGN